VRLEITPEPSEEERQAIEAALAAQEAERETMLPWPRAALPQRGDEQDEPTP
jgi:hypothetical protein